MRTRERRADLRRLESAAADAKATWLHARDAAERVPETPEAGRPLTDLFHRVAFNQRLGNDVAQSRAGKHLFGATSSPTDADVDEAVKVTRELCERVIADGLVLAPVNLRAPAAGFVLYDPALIRAVDDAEAEMRDTEAQLAAAHAEHDAALEEEERSRAVKDFRDSLVSDDPEKVAAAFEAVRKYDRPEVREDAMTTADLVRVA